MRMACLCEREKEKERGYCGDLASVTSSQMRRMNWFIAGNQIGLLMTEMKFFPGRN
jgi:hypothetical protein